MSPESAVKAVIFDLGNVLVDFDHRLAAKRISAYTPRSAGQIYDLFFDSEITRLFEGGRIKEDDFFEQVKSALDLNLDYSGFLPIWNEIFYLSEKNRQVIELARNLKERYTTAILSNINILHYEYLRHEFSVFEPFHNIFTSCQMGCVKPDHQIYNQALRQLGVSAQEAFYTDDRPDLVESAAQLGITSRIFRGVEELKRELVSAGVNI